ncbi:kinase [Capsaspora owczarzaki ATCC 30864]|uniref:Protein-serine/threonine kinase n=1 Tax=Capsaspora owczarzaki (strain ATCC 30864) TaxID=595528 RepID=A0A0D2VXA6_CAPO3|nr:kinase [Capsaspora owczarzaki ATCC 30864]KJE96262.1 kinase [Capsaspora owczarzaki ATCC 30864]|eukprot:XP_004344232.2 kinase [Capsaspora owczarzaki ATCC 30864]
MAQAAALRSTLRALRLSSSSSSPPSLPVLAHCHHYHHHEHHHYHRSHRHDGVASSYGGSTVHPPPPPPTVDASSLPLRFQAPHHRSSPALSIQGTMAMTTTTATTATRRAVHSITRSSAALPAPSTAAAHPPLVLPPTHNALNFAANNRVQLRPSFRKITFHSTSGLAPSERWRPDHEEDRHERALQKSATPPVTFGGKLTTAPSPANASKLHRDEFERTAGGATSQESMATDEHDEHTSHHDPAVVHHHHHHHHHQQTRRKQAAAPVAGALTSTGASSLSVGTARPASASFYDTSVDFYASQPVTRMTMKTLFEFGQNLKSDESRKLLFAKYLQNELPIRLAHRIRDFQKLPFIVGCNPHIQSVYSLYLRSFDSLRQWPPIETMEQERAFTEMLTRLVDDHLNVVVELGKGCVESKRYMPVDKLNRFLDLTLQSRIGVRMLAEQHLALHNQQPGFIGIICEKLPPRAIVEKVADIAGTMCQHHYGVAPEVEIQGHVDTVFSYIPAHLEYMLLELVKNAMRATVEHNWSRRQQGLPKIVATICKGTTDITIRLSDQGGGIPPHIMPEIWTYSFTTADMETMTRPEEEDSDNPMDFVNLMDGSASHRYGPLAGLGFGLPMSRVNAEYFGGSLNICSMHGYGCDVFLRLNHIGDTLESFEI